MMKPLPIALAIIVATACGIGYYGIHVPAQHEVRLIQTQIAEERASQGTKGDVAALLARIEHYRERLPKDADPSWLAQEVVALAQKTGVQLTSMTQDAPQPLDTFTRLSVNLQVAATYHQLGAFLDEVERSPHFIRIDRLSLDHADGDERGLVQVTFSTVVLPPVIEGVGT
jgi:Tfp pilus assembly protein PilO